MKLNNKKLGKKNIEAIWNALFVEWEPLKINGELLMVLGDILRFYKDNEKDKEFWKDYLIKKIDFLEDFYKNNELNEENKKALFRVIIIARALLTFYYE